MAGVLSGAQHPVDASVNTAKTVKRQARRKSRPDDGEISRSIVLSKVASIMEPIHGVRYEQTSQASRAALAPGPERGPTIPYLRVVTPSNYSSAVTFVRFVTIAPRIFSRVWGACLFFQLPLIAKHGH